MKFSSEIYSLLVISLATSIMWVPYVAARMTTHGLIKAIGNPGPGYPTDAPWADRARRAHINAIENLAVFAPVVLAAAVVEVSNNVTVVSAKIYVAARLAHYALYVAGIPFFRTLAFLLGSAATVAIAMVALVSAA